MAAILFVAALALIHPGSHSGALQPYPLPIGLTVSFPAKPEPMNLAKGDDRKAYSCETESALFYASDSPVSPEEQKALPPDQQLAAYVSGLLIDAPDRHVVRYNEVLMDGWPGVEYRIDDKKEGASTWSRCYCMNGHIIEVGTLFGTDAGAPDSATEFFDSVKQTGSRKCGPKSDCTFDFTRIQPDGVPVSIDFPADVKDDAVDLSKDEFKMVLHRFTFERDMRTFDYEYLDLPSDAEASLSADDITDLRQRALDSVIKNVEGEGDPASIQQRDGNDWLSANFHIGNAAFGRVDVMYFKGRVYTLIAIGPEPWSESDEYKRFFDSVEVKN